jgi:hypothetical protein
MKTIIKLLIPTLLLVTGLCTVALLLSTRKANAAAQTTPIMEVIMTKASMASDTYTNEARAHSQKIQAFLGGHNNAVASPTICTPATASGDVYLVTTVGLPTEFK